MCAKSAPIESVATSVRSAESVVAMTGAGVSTASGIPDFRGEDGLWENYDPKTFHVSRFRSDPAGFWEDRVELQESIFGDGTFEPNAAHEAIADLERDGHLDTVVTQNIDGLHQAAGSEDVVEIHGSAQRVTCQDCRRRTDASPVMERAKDGELPPTCGECGGVLKPDTVLFGEQLPEHALMRAHASAQQADVFLAIGSSLTVEPAASIPRDALSSGGDLVVVNLDETPLSDRATVDVRADVTEFIPRLRDAVRE